MERLRSKNVFNNLTLKITSFIIGYAVWFMMSQSQTHTALLTIPICLYNNTAATFDAPESVHVTLHGKRADIFALDRHNLAVHIDAQTLHAGKNQLPISAQTLFLPSSIKLVHYSPANIIITMHEKASRDEQTQTT